jgi:hypothetical protein
MSAEETAAVVRRYSDLVNHLDEPGRFEIVAPDVVLREPRHLIGGHRAGIESRRRCALAGG